MNVESSVAREIRDPEALALAAFAALVTYVIGHDWRLALIGVIGTLAVRVVAGVVLHGTHPPVQRQFPDLDEDASMVAWYIYRGRGDPAIARRTGFSLKKVRELERQTMRAWHITTRDEIALHVADILNELPPRRPSTKGGREWMGEFGTALGVMGIGLGILALPPNTAVVGGVRDWLGLCLVAAGLIFVLISTITFVWENRRSQDH